MGKADQVIQRMGSPVILGSCVLLPTVHTLLQEGRKAAKFDVRVGLAQVSHPTPPECGSAWMARSNARSVAVRGAARAAAPALSSEASACVLPLTVLGRRLPPPATGTAVLLPGGVSALTAAAALGAVSAA